MALTDTLSATMIGSVGTTTLNDMQKALLDPKAAELDILISDIRSRVHRDAKDSRATLEETNSAIAATLGTALELEFIEN